MNITISNLIEALATGAVAAGAAAIAARLDKSGQAGPSKARSKIASQLGPQLLVGLLASAIAWIATGWIAACLWAFVGGASIPVLIRGDRERKQRVQALDAAASWVSLLRGQLAGGAALAQALPVSCERAPIAMGEDLVPLAQAVRAMGPAKGIEHWRPNAPAYLSDVAVVLEVAAGGEGSQVGSVLSIASGRLRAKAAAARRIERDRKRMRIAGRGVSVLLAAWVLGSARFGGTIFATAYGGFAGQVVLAVVLGVLGASMAWLIALDGRVDGVA